MARPIKPETQAEYSKTLKRIDLPEGIVFLNKHMSHGVTEYYSVSVRQGKKKRVFRFKSLATADTLIERIRLNDWSVLLPDICDPERHLVEALQIIGNPTMRHTGEVLVPLLAAIDREVSLSEHKRRLNHRNYVAQLLKDHQRMPTDPRYFIQWLDECFAILTTKTLTGVLSYATVIERIATFKRMLMLVAKYPYVFAPVFQEVVRLVPERAEYWKRQASQRSMQRQSFAPLTLAELDDFLHAAPSLQVRLHILTVLTMGFRPSEARDITNEHIQDGKVVLRNLTTKVRGVKAMPTAPVVLKLLLTFKQPLTAKDKKWLSREAEYNLRQLRTTTAVHLFFSTKDPILVMGRLGHKTMRMIQEHYVLMRPKDLENDVIKAAEYYGVKPVTVNGVNVSQEATAWDNYILYLTLNAMHKASTPNEFEAVKLLLIRLTTDGGFAEEKRLVNADF